MHLYVSPAAIHWLHGHAFILLSPASLQKSCRDSEGQQCRKSDWRAGRTGTYLWKALMPSPMMPYHQGVFVRPRDAVTFIIHKMCFWYNQTAESCRIVRKMFFLWHRIFFSAVSFFLTISDKLHDVWFLRLILTLGSSVKNVMALHFIFFYN